MQLEINNEETTNSGSSFPLQTLQSTRLDKKYKMKEESEAEPVTASKKHKGRTAKLIKVHLLTATSFSESPNSVVHYKLLPHFCR